MKRTLGRVLAGLLWGSALLYSGDWGVWRARVAMGGGMGKVTLDVMIGTPLKNGREEYDWNGTQTVDCSRSLFPHTGQGACWWLARQKTLNEM